MQTAFTEGYDLTKAARFFDTLNMRRCRLSQNVSNINTVFAKATVEVSKILDEYWNEFLASSWANDTPIVPQFSFIVLTMTTTHSVAFPLSTGRFYSGGFRREGKKSVFCCDCL